MVRAGLNRSAHTLTNPMRRTTIPQALLALALVSWALAMWRSQLSIGPYGLIHSLSPLFFLATGLLSVSFLVALMWSRSGTYLLAIHLVALLAFAHLTPIILEGTPRFPYIYESYGYADYLVRNGSLDLGLSYHNWPALHLVNAALVEVSGIDPIDLLLWSAPILHGIALLIIAFVSRVLSETREESWIALWLAVLFTAGGGYDVPGVMASLLMMAALALVSLDYLRQTPSPRSSFGYQCALLVLLVAVVPTHLLRSVALVISLALGYVVAKVTGARTGRLSTAILLAVCIACWMLYVAVSLTASLLPRILGEILNLDAVVATTGQLATSGAPQHTLVVLVRTGYGAALSLLALSTCASRLVSTRRLRIEWALPAAWVAAAASTVLLTAYSGEILGRALGLAFFALVVLASKQLVSTRLPVVAVVMLIAGLLYPINAWGNERVDYVSGSELASVQFFYENRPRSYGLATYPTRVWKYQYVEYYGPGQRGDWEFTGLGLPSQQHESFLRGTDELSSYLREYLRHAGRVYDSGSMEILAQRKETLR
jgi:hypothetical protein